MYADDTKCKRITEINVKSHYNMECLYTHTLYSYTSHFQQLIHTLSTLIILSCTKFTGQIDAGRANHLLFQSNERLNHDRIFVRVCFVYKAY